MQKMRCRNSRYTRWHRSRLGGDSLESSWEGKPSPDPTALGNFDARVCPHLHTMSGYAAGQSTRTSMVWPTLASRTAEEQNRAHRLLRFCAFQSSTKMKSQYSIVKSQYNIIHYTWICANLLNYNAVALSRFSAGCYACAVLAMGLWLCLSDTSRCSTKTPKHRITQTKPHDRAGSLVFRCQRSHLNHPLWGCQMQVGWVKIGDFRLNSWLYLENGIR